MLGARGAGAAQTLQLPAKQELLVLGFRSVVTGFNPVFLQLKCQVGTARERNQLGPRGSSGTCPEEQPRALCCSCLFPLLSGGRSSDPSPCQHSSRPGSLPQIHKALLCFVCALTPGVLLRCTPLRQPGWLGWPSPTAVGKGSCVLLTGLQVNVPWLLPRIPGSVFTWIAFDR